MKIHDLLLERKQIDEAPLGLLKKTGLGVAKAFGSGNAAGKLDTGNTANELHKNFMTYLGKTGEEPEAATLIAFLKSQGYPTAKASKLLGMPAEVKPNPAADQAAQVRKDKQGAAASSAQSQMAANAKVAAAQPKPQTPADIRSQKQAAAAKAAQDQMAANPAPAKPKAAPVAAPTPTRPEKDSMGRIEPTFDPEAPKSKAKRPSRPSQATIDKDRNRIMGPTSDSVVRHGNVVAEALTSQQIDSALLAAAQERAALGGFGGASASTASPTASRTSQQPATVPTKSASPAGGGAASSAGRIAKNLLTPKSMPGSGSSTSSSDDMSSLLDGIDVPLFKTTLKQVIQKQEPDALGLREINKFYNKL